MTQGTYIHGPSGVGKSHMAFQGFTPETHYVKCLEDEWWDGYTGQPIVIINEFRGQIKLSELFDLVDKNGQKQSSKDVQQQRDATLVA